MQVSSLVGKIGNVSDRFSDRDSPGEHAQSVYESVAQPVNDDNVPQVANLAPDIKFTKLEIVQ